MRPILAALLPIVALSSACTDLAGAEDEDPIDSSFPDGKADASTVVEGSSQALGVLSLANEVSFSTLDEDVGLSSRAARAILDARKGADGELLTEDDQIIWSLAELDALPYVGPIALQKLDNFSHDNGYYNENNNRAVLYSYGTMLGTSRLYLNDDGTGYVEDETRGDAKSIERSKIEGVPSELVDQLREQIAAALPGEHEREPLPGSTVEPEGKLSVYLWDGTASVIDSYEHTDSGYVHVLNVEPSAEQIRATIADLVQFRMPSMPMP